MTTNANLSCRVCQSPARFVRTQRLLGHEVAYFDCPTCGHFQTETPHWLAEAYASAINDVDTGILARNQLNVRRVIMTLAAFGRLQGRVVDEAGGYGVLVRLLRDVGVNAFWRDKYCENLLAKGFEAGDSPGDAACDLLTAFEVFEHYESPLAELEHMLTQAPAVLLSTDLIPGPDAPPSDWWYFGPEHGQHIGFFRRQTLAWMARRLGCHLASDGRTLHVFAREPVPRGWRLMQRAKPLAYALAAWRLRSKTMADFEWLRRARR